jgi:acetyl esterase/lipase
MGRVLTQAAANGIENMKIEWLTRLVAVAFFVSAITDASALRAQDGVPDGVELHVDIPYREGNDKWKLDLALPTKASDTPRAAIVFVHGGGWRGGDKVKGQWRALPLRYAEMGYVAISVNYRFVKEALFPACVEDVKCSVRWLRANAKKYNVDPERIGAYGNSAGAHLVSLLGLAGKEAKLEGDGPFQDQSSSLQAVCASATPTDFVNWGKDKEEDPPRPMRVLAGDDATYDARAKNGSPITHVHKDAPPFLLIHGNADPVVPIAQSDRFAKALRAAGAKDVTFMIIDDANHGVFGRNSTVTHAAMESFFAKSLNGKRSASTSSPKQRQRRRRQGGGNRWAQMDTDKDGKISRDEATGLMKKFFDRNDANGDGVLDKSELEALARRLDQPRRGQNRQQP